MCQITSGGLFLDCLSSRRFVYHGVSYVIRGVLVLATALLLGIERSLIPSKV